MIYLLEDWKIIIIEVSVRLQPPNQAIMWVNTSPVRAEIQAFIQIETQSVNPPTSQTCKELNPTAFFPLLNFFSINNSTYRRRTNKARGNIPWLLVAGSRKSERFPPLEDR